MKVGSLFSGIGGFDIGLERAGYDIAWQVEIDPYCQRVLAKHWPGVTRYGDITTIDWATVPRIDLLCGGFPCQDLSFAGKRAGIDGARSGLWSEYVRAIVQLRPRYVLVENVPGLLTNAYMGRVLGDLAASGYDAEWDCLPAEAFGAAHKRDRVYILAYPQKQYVSNSYVGANGNMETSNRGSKILEFGGRTLPKSLSERDEPSPYFSVPTVAGMDDGLPCKLDMDRIKGQIHGLGNAIVPQIVEALGRMILEAENTS